MRKPALEPMITAAMRQGLEPLPSGYRWKRPNRSKYGDLQRLRAQRGVGAPPARILLPIKTDLVQL
jgi:hypothetical protein